MKNEFGEVFFRVFDPVSRRYVAGMRNIGQVFSTRDTAKQFASHYQNYYRPGTQNDPLQIHEFELNRIR
jgi:hypothetical protein